MIHDDGPQRVGEAMASPLGRMQFVEAELPNELRCCLKRYSDFIGKTITRRKIEITLIEIIRLQSST